MLNFVVVAIIILPRYYLQKKVLNMTNCIDCGAKTSNYKAERCKKCYTIYQKKLLADEDTRAKRSIIYKEALIGKKYNLSEKQLKNMAEGRKLVPKGFNGYFKVKFKADQDILDKAEAFIKTQPFIFDSGKVYNHLIDTNDDYVQNRLSHNSIQPILMKLGYTPVKYKGRTNALWYKRDIVKGAYALKMKIRNYLMIELDISKPQANLLLNILKGDDNGSK